MRSNVASAIITVYAEQRSLDLANLAMRGLSATVVRRPVGSDTSAAARIKRPNKCISGSYLLCGSQQEPDRQQRRSHQASGQYHRVPRKL
jgi:hypothetical protein